MPDQKLTAIVGDSGSGKSTILNLIAKYYEVSGGTISIGGRPINHVAAERVLDQISMVDQDVFLFDDTVRENIRHARPDATDAEIEVACREANCDGFIRKMERGYDTPIGENGNLLSGGERQRLSIARAILKNSPILLLDEATASLDIENELAVKQAIANLLKEKKTVVMIAHTLSIVKKCRSDSGGFRWSDHRSWYTRRIVSKGWKVRCHVERRTAAFRLKGGYDEDSCVRGGLSGGCADTPKEARMVRSVDLARHMGFSKPSISHAVGILKNGGFLTVDEDGFLHLTAIGHEVAEKNYMSVTDFSRSSLSLLASIRKQRNKTPAGLNTPSVIHLSES